MKQLAICVGLVAFLLNFHQPLTHFLLSKLFSYSHIRSSFHLSSPQLPLRNLTEEELATFERDGVVMVSGLMQEEWIRETQRAVEQLKENPAISALFMNAGPGYVMEAYMWKTSDFFRDLAFFSPLPLIAHQILRSSKVNFLYDQLFCKAPGSQAPTPWHQDLTFWPIAHTVGSDEGAQIVSIWLALDDITQENSGLDYIRGSHKWGARYRSVSPDYNPVLLDSDLPFAPSNESLRAHPDLINWRMKAGDMIIFHPLILHGSGGNLDPTRQRRAIALRYTGDNVVYRQKPATMAELTPWPHDYSHGNLLKDGDSLSCSLYPQVLPSLKDSEIKHRFQGIELPWTSLSLKVPLRQLGGAIKGVIRRLRGQS